MSRTEPIPAKMAPVPPPTEHRRLRRHCDECGSRARGYCLCCRSDFCAPCMSGHACALGRSAAIAARLPAAVLVVFGALLLLVSLSAALGFALGR